MWIDIILMKVESSRKVEKSGIRCASEIKFSGKIVADEVDQWILGKEIEL